MTSIRPLARPRAPFSAPVWQGLSRTMGVLPALLLFFVFAGQAAAQVFPVEVLHYTGSPDERLNMVILGDGYTIDQQDKFMEDARRMAEGMFLQEPFSSQKELINLYAVKVVSNESGAAMDPNRLIDNYFGSSYWSYGIERLLWVWRLNRVANVLQANTPFYDEGVIMVNDPKYGGAGGQYAVFSTNAQALEIMLHELGHSLGGLADEYWAGNQYARENTNMTQDNDPQTNRWRDFLYENGIGIYPHEESPTWYRPHQNCKMRYLGRDFCDVCDDALSRNIRSMTSPDLFAMPVAFFGASDLHVEVGSQVQFYDMSSFRPVAWEWTFEGGEPAESMEQNPAVTYAETLTVTNHRGPNTHTKEAYINVAPPDVTSVTAPGALPVLHIYPNPVAADLRMEYDAALEGAAFTVLNALGGTVLTGRVQESVPVHALPPGAYVLRIDTPAGPLTRRFLKQ